MEFTIRMKYVRATKRTFVYGNDGDGAFISTLYLSKNAFTDGQPTPDILVKVQGVGTPATTPLEDF